MTNFAEELEKLNPKQREAVEAIEGPVMVIAGPGTGKTQMLTLRIANILAKTDTSADAILALTFTEAAAANMRKRLVGIIGSRGYYVRISTFHGFCNALIREYPEKYPRIIGGTHAMPVDVIAIVREIIERGQWSDLRPFADTFYYVPDIIKAVKDIKQEGMTPEQFTELVEEQKATFESRNDLQHEKGRFAGTMKGEHKKTAENFRRLKELAAIYADYQRILQQRKLYDFDDMILETIRAMETDKDFLSELQEKHQYLLVDEHQDTNGAQNKVLELLAGFFQNPNLFVVGDEKQAIFRFQGASLDNFLYFKNKFKSVKLVELGDNYRSTQAILDAAQSLIEKNAARLSGVLTAVRTKGRDSLHIWRFAHPEAELLFLAEEIKKLSDAGVAWNEIAVLFRENRDATPIADFFAAEGIPFVVESDRNLLANGLIVKLTVLLDAVYRFGDDEALATALHVDFLELDPMDVYALLKHKEKDTDGNAHGNDDTGLYSTLKHERSLAQLALEHPEKLHELYAKLSLWKRKSENEELAKFVARLMKESGFLRHALKGSDYALNMEAVGTFFDEVKKMSENHQDCKLRDLMDYLEVLKGHGVVVKERNTRFENAVRLMTAHKAKGLEFTSVFVTGAYDGHWGNKRSHAYFSLPFRTVTDISEFEKNEDERRLFYMAITRAKRDAYITWSETASDGRERVPCQFVGEIREDLKDIRSGEAFDALFSGNRERFMTAPVSAGAKPEKEYFAQIFLHRGLSATALNNYLSCPWKYFYQNLLRLPQVPSITQIYGIAAHRALQTFFDAVRDGKEPGKDLLLDAFTRDLAHKPIKEADRERLKEKGVRSLGGYFDAWHASWRTETVNEFRISGVLLNGVKLTGNLDKLEVAQDGIGAVVVDYKTKQPQSRNWIEGKTEARQSGEYKRQLVFYKLLLDLKPEKTYSMREAVIDFLEPNDSGKYKRESFIITDEEARALQLQIGEVADEIRELRFWDKRCDDKECAFCALRDMMK